MNACKERLHIGTRLAALLVVAGCAGGPSAQVDAALRRGEVAQALVAYDQADGSDPALLAQVAGVVLENEALSHTPSARAQAMAALALAGTSAKTALQHLAAGAGRPLVAADAGLRAQAIALLARLGDETARRALQSMIHDPDPEVVASAVQILDPLRDIVALRALAASPASSVRAAAVSALARALPDAETSLALARAGRDDPSIAVRVSALYALGHQGPLAAAELQPRLDDPEPSVRQAAVGALVQADFARAVVRLERYLAAAPSPEAIESARALLSADPQRAPLSARTQLGRALIHSDGRLRAQAAVALMSLHEPRFAALVLRRAPHEGAREIRLCLALALDADAPQRSALLQALLSKDDVSGVQAAAELARAGDSAASEKLLALLHSKTPAVRGIAVRALAHDLGRVEDVRSLLLDGDSGVRIAAAGAMLSAPRHVVR